jgi:hypothetical protein
LLGLMSSWTKPERVDVVEGAGQLDEDLDDGLARGAAQELGERLARQQLLREVDDVAVAAPEVVDRGEVRVVELREQAKLRLEVVHHRVDGGRPGCCRSCG